MSGFFSLDSMCNRLHARLMQTGIYVIAAALFLNVLLPLSAHAESAADRKRVVLKSVKTMHSRIPKRTKRKYIAKRPEPMPFYVMNNTFIPAVKNFAISGYMGDVSDLRLAGEYERPHQEGYPALRIIYSAQGLAGWVGVLWQNPANNWGEFDGGYNLTKARKLSFWACGEKGGESVEFVLGGTSSNIADSDSLSSGEITLANRWTRYVLDLTTAKLNYISAGFGFVLKEDSNPKGCTFFLDDVRYEE